ncbi:MAG: glycosyltransferase family 9 protein [Prevotellaceae bacterium]|jgi:heptosyltransferase-2|nr:glycosyltransferase family 9 protein [Prevotellaceae bacterium]
MKILIIRFRQIGDSVLTLALCSSLRASFDNAEIHLVLNKSIASLFDNHPNIDKIITFDKSETSGFSYIKKVWKTMHENHYDIIIDMRSTIKTSLFSLFSLHTDFRIGRKKWYNLFIHNHRIENKNTHDKLDKIGKNLMLLSPLEKKYHVKYSRNFNLSISAHENAAFKNYMIQNGVDFSRPVILAAVASKLLHKMWNINRMTEILHRILDNYDVQIILNYVPGHEEKIAHEIYEKLNHNKNIFIDINAGSLRGLASLCSFCTLFFGNEGGTRHIAHAVDVPSFCIISPDVKKSVWLPQNDIEAIGISVDDLDEQTSQKNKNLTYQQLYDLITVDVVWEQLNPMLEKYLKNNKL